MPQETKNRQRQHERLHLLHFVNVFSDFPAGELEFGDKPDLILHTVKGDLGIEHTQLFQVEQAPGIATPQAQERLQEKVVSRAKKLFEERGGGLLWLYAQFSRDRNNILSNHTVDEVASRLADVVAHAVQLSGQNTNDGVWRSLDKWAYDDRFPSQIDQIDFQKVDRPGFVLWGVPRSCFVPEITTCYIQEKISGKDSKVTSYLNRCSEVWLLMVAENGVPSSYFNISTEVAEFTYQSEFDRVFYFENFDSTVIELKVARASGGLTLRCT